MDIVHGVKPFSTIVNMVVCEEVVVVCEEVVEVCEEESKTFLQIIERIQVDIGRPLPCLEVIDAKVEHLAREKNDLRLSGRTCPFSGCRSATPP